MVEEANTKQEVEKSLAVKYPEGIPVFTFSGIWTGKDVNNILRLIRREYLLHNRQIRRSASEQEQSPAKE